MNITRSKTEVIPCIYERSFAYIYDQDEVYLAKFLAYILRIDYLSLLGNIKRISNNAKIKHKNDKKRQMDFVYRIEHLKIDIELNLRAKHSIDRNIGYLTNLHSNNIKKGQYDYSDYRTYQININNENILKTDRVIDEYLFRNIDGDILTTNIRVYTISIPNLRKLCYNKEKEVLEEFKYLIPFMTDDTSIYKKMFQKDDKMKEVFDRMENFSNDEEWVTFRSENEIEETNRYALKMERKEAREAGLAEGLKEGLKEGLEQKQQEIVGNMLKEGMDISLISKVTNLSKEEILEIKNK